MTLQETYDEMDRTIAQARAAVEALRPDVALYGRGCDALAKLTSGDPRHPIPASFTELIAETGDLANQGRLRPEFIIRDGRASYLTKPDSQLLEQLSSRLDGAKWDMGTALIKVRDRAFAPYDGTARALKESAERQARLGQLPGGPNAVVKLRYRIARDFREWLELLLTDRLKIA